MRLSRARSCSLSSVAFAIAFATTACLPPSQDTAEPPDDRAISEQRALELGMEALRSRCWSSARWRTIWWDKRERWVVWCRMEDDEAFAECSAHVDAQTGEVKIQRLCTSTSW